MNGLDFGSRTFIMGILNLTPDSFSGDGLHNDVDRAVEEAERIAGEGADIIDIGGESTRPGAEPVPLEEEIKRVVPVVERLARKIKIPISVDTRKSEVALRALDKGASIINDITGLEYDNRMTDVVARYDAGVIIMHIKGEPRTMQKSPVYGNLIKEILEKLTDLVERAEKSGIKKENIIVDPGIGFGKTFDHNLEILNNLSVFRGMGKPILVGTSRKSFIGNILDAEPRERIWGVAASVAISINNGADIVRVHDVKQMKQVAMVADAIVKNRERIHA
ncbi:MAG: dihydropteroate synthase [Candidatus Omnitrophica bacterium]|nr:dihydropteroate synthase [Candidatus Omnitrophota bacterium]MBU1932433.1 dihydropteroate synthase [Candidatus Omnitrophota bacterium]